jgi:hypothetical protein
MISVTNLFGVFDGEAVGVNVQVGMGVFRRRVLNGRPTVGVMIRQPRELAAVDVRVGVKASSDFRITGR